MKLLEHYVRGQWVSGTETGQILTDAVTGHPIASTSTKGIDFKSMIEYARNTGNPALRSLTFHERGLRLKALALHLQKHLPAFYSLSYKTGATKADSWVDIEGGIGNLFANASLRKRFPNETFCIDGESHNLGKQHTFMGTHLLVPKEGVAIHINAFNFPVWGMLEKIAVNLLAGVPAIVKPATVTSYLTEAVFKEIIASNLFPAGSLQLICGSAGNLLDWTDSQDIVTFTGSAHTGALLKKTPAILANNVPFTMEADSLNCIVLGESVQPDDPEWDLFVKEVRKEMTLKAGQRCTGVRRIFVPERHLEAMATSLQKALSQTVIGSPLHEKVRMGSLAGQTQRKEVLEQVTKLLASSQLIYGTLESIDLVDADWEKGAFISPLLLLNTKPFSQTASHEIEAFGPISTKLILNRDCAKESTGHGSPLPLLVHGGPGRAGGGEEMGGIRGVKHYLQRTAIQGSPTMITAITNVYQPHAQGKDPGKHPFKKYFEELQIGDQFLTAPRTITTTDIDQFADLSGDHFYAHLRETDFSGTMFENQVAHGYLIMSLAAGLFVDSYEKNPVLLNYGIDELRFTKPVYPGSEIKIRFTCKEKLIQDKRVVENPADAKRGDEIDKGIVKWLVEILDETNEITGIATILTMVAKKEQTV